MNPWPLIVAGVLWLAFRLTAAAGHDDLAIGLLVALGGWLVIVVAALP